MSDKELREYFDFNEGDLAANRSGQHSARQKKRLDENERGASKILIGFGVLLILIALGVSVGVGSSVLADGLTSEDTLGLLLGIGLPVLLLGFFAWGSFKIAFSKMDNSVQRVEGRVNFVKVEKSVPTSTSSTSSYRTVEEYELRVGKVSFDDFDEDLLNIIEEGDTYAFYYTKDAKQILSAEFVKKGK
jgi:hypothetical protein